jgi:hypothetical protein
VGNLSLLKHPPTIASTGEAYTSVVRPFAGFEFACLVNERLKLYAELDILFLRPELPGSIIGTGGDIDNRLKTLFDGLRQPLDANELPKGVAPGQGEKPFHCLLSDDALITKVSVTTDRLLCPISKDEVMLIIHVTLRAVELTFDNVSLVG